MCFILFLVKLTFAVAQFDRYYTSDSEENNPDESKVKQLVSEAFDDVQEVDVFPVCGKWVLNAYLLKNRPNASELGVRQAYEVYMERTTGSSSVDEQSHMIDTIVEKGGLWVLQKRYKVAHHNETMF